MAVRKKNLCKHSFFSLTFCYLCNMNKNVSLHIEYLLTRHDCVIVPGWGALVVQHTPAVFDADNGILPPRRWMSFNSHLTHNDGLLAHSIMQVEHCSYDAAMAIINKQVHAWRNELMEGATVKWDRIGSFVRQEQGTMLFAEEDQSVVNATMSLYEPLSLPLLTEVLPIYDEDEPAIHMPSQASHISWHRKAWQAVATVAAAVIVMLFIATPIDSYTPTNDYASLVVNELLRENVTASVAVMADDVAQTPDKIDATTLEVVEEMPQQQEPVVEAVAEKPATLAAVQERVTPRYILVIGSLPSQRLAEKQIAEFRAAGVDDEINIYACDGKYRLYVEGYGTLAEAQQRVADAATQSLYPGVWICATRR